MTEISRLKSTPVALLVVLGLMYFGLVAYFTAVFVGWGLKGHLSIYLLASVLTCIYSARMFWTWCGLVASGMALNFRGLHVTAGKLAYISPKVRAFDVSEITDVRAVDMRLGWKRQPFIEFGIRGGGKWRLPGFLLREPMDVAVARARSALNL